MTTTPYHAKYIISSSELAEFLEVPYQHSMMLHDIIRKLNNRIRQCGNLKKQTYMVSKDSILSKLFKLSPGDVLTDDNIFRYLSPHIILETNFLMSKKLNASSQQLSSQQIKQASYSLQNENQPEQTSKMSSKATTLSSSIRGQRLATMTREQLDKTLKEQSTERPKTPPSPVVHSSVVPSSVVPSSVVPLVVPYPVIQQSPPLPVDNINLCFVGGVSTGKSTILNAIFCEKLTECKIKRTTMVPTVYIENESDAPNREDPEQIFAKIAKVNADIIAKDESGAKVSDQEYAELQFNVGKLDINILPDSYVNVYDIPGLNDARTKNLYYKYLERNFFKFNLIIFIVDIHSGLNTSDETDILRFIAEHTKLQLDKHQKKIYTLVVVNKADDMQLVPGKDELEITGELGEMYDQVKKSVDEVFKQNNITEHLAGIIPLCAIDSYLYRMTKTHKETFIDKLLPEQILKIGVNEMGKKFSTKKPEDQKSEVRKILANEEFVETMITLSGFGRFEQLLAEFLEKNNTGKKIRIDNLLFEFKKLPKIGPYITAHPDKIETIVGICHDIFKIFEVILKIDKDIGEALITETLLHIEDALQKYLEPWILRSTISDLQSIMAYYTQFRYAIFVRYFDTKRDWSVYPAYMQKLIHSRLCILLSTNMITPAALSQGLELCKMIGLMTKIRFQSIVDSVLRNANKYSALITNTISEDNKQLILFVKMGEKLGVDMMTFLRYIILNRISDSRNTSDRILFQKQMIYLQNQEVPIYSYLQFVNSGRRVSPEWVVEGITEAMMKDPEHELDYEYLNRVCCMPKGTF
jgi:GTP-binding protein EngB required for normal cell division